MGAPRPFKQSQAFCFLQEKNKSKQENSTIDIDGGLCQYETSLDSSASMKYLSSFTTIQLINGALRGKLIK